MNDLARHLAGLPSQTRQLLLRIAACRPFALIQELLLRATLLRLHHHTHLLLLAMHDIIIDGCSVGVLVRELDADQAAT